MLPGKQLPSQVGVWSSNFWCNKLESFNSLNIYYVVGTLCSLNTFLLTEEGKMDINIKAGPPPWGLASFIVTQNGQSGLNMNAFIFKSQLY